MSALISSEQQIQQVYNSLLKTFASMIYANESYGKTFRELLSQQSSLLKTEHSHDPRLVKCSKTIDWWLSTFNDSEIVNGALASYSLSETAKYLKTILDLTILAITVDNGIRSSK